MKKILLLMLALVLSIGLIACGEPTSESKPESQPSSVESTVESESESAESTTESVVESAESTTESVVESVVTTYTVTFVQEGCEDVVVTVEEGKGVDSIPEPASVKGHTVSWDKTAADLAEITENVTVTAIAVPNVYVITFIVDVEGVAVPEDLEVTYGEEFTLPTIANGAYEFKHWETEDGEVFTVVDAYSIDGNLTLIAVFHNYSYPY